MSPSTATENSPLLQKHSNSDDTVTILDDDINGNISVITTDCPKDDDNDDDLLKRRLKGSSLMVLLIGYLNDYRIYNVLKLTILLQYLVSGLVLDYLLLMPQLLPPSFPKSVLSLKGERVFFHSWVEQS